MHKSVNKELVLIEPDPIEKAKVGLIVSEESMEQAIKSQNRGVVKKVGSLVTWPVEGMYISFYRKAATESVEGDEQFVVIHENHCLCEFSK